jgi:hypothetical protein
MARGPPTALSRFWALVSGNAQQAHVEQGATAIQVIGDDNVVILAGEAKLHAEFRHLRAAAPRDLRDLLQPELRAIERVGHQEEFAALQAWTTTRHQGRDIAVHCVTGQAAAGKTRHPAQRGVGFELGTPEGSPKPKASSVAALDLDRGIVNDIATAVAYGSGPRHDGRRRHRADTPISGAHGG